MRRLSSAYELELPQQQIYVGALAGPEQLPDSHDGEVAVGTDTLAERNVDVHAQIARG